MRRALLRLVVAFACSQLLLGCESIVGEVEIRDPAAGEACAKRDTCGPGSDCLLVDASDDEGPKMCLPVCGGKRDPACPAAFTCAPDSQYSTASSHCRPTNTVKVYKVGERCDASYRDPCPPPSRCAVRPSDRDVGGDVSTYCIVPCAGGDDEKTCSPSESCSYAKDGYYCER